MRSLIIPLKTTAPIRRSKFRPAIITVQPLPTAPIRFSSGILTLSKSKYPFGTFSNPIKGLIFSKENPGVPFSTRKEVI